MFEHISLMAHANCILGATAAAAATTVVAAIASATTVENQRRQFESSNVFENNNRSRATPTFRANVAIGIERFFPPGSDL